MSLQAILKQADMPPNPFAVEKGRRGLMRVATGTAIQKQLSAANSLQTAARRGLQISKATSGQGSQVAGTTSMKRKVQSSAPLPPQQPKIAEAVFAEFVKAAMSKDQQRRRRHAYYVQNRNQILQKKRAYRQRNKQQIRLQQRKYRRKVKMGTQKQRRRISTGGHSVMYGGYR